MRLEKYLLTDERKSYKESLEEVLETLRRDCEPFLKEIAPRDILLYRGSDRIFMNDISKPHTPRKDRRPKDMKEWMFDLTNYAFKKAFGWEARKEGVFAVGLSKIAKMYGNPYLFFPIGRYEYIWSKNVKDLYIMREVFKDMWDMVETKMMVEKTIEDDRDIFEAVDLERFYNAYDNAVDAFIKGDEMSLYREAHKNSVNIMNMTIGEQTNYETKDFRDKTMEEMKKLTTSFVKRNYIDSSLRTYRHNKRHEIMFRCKKYYLVQPEFTEDIMKELL